MGIVLPVGVANYLGTPAAITDSIANQPSALDIANGTIYIAPDVPAIYTNDNGTWKSLSGGGGGGGLLTADNGLTANSSTNVQLGGTLLDTTYIYGNAKDFYLYGFTNASLANNNGLGLYIENDTVTINTKPNSESGFLFVEGQSIRLGDLISQNGLPSIWIDQQKNSIQLNANNTGLFADGMLGITYLGDSNDQGNRTKFLVYDGANEISSTWNGDPNGIYINFQYKLFQFGEYFGNILYLDLNTDQKKFGLIKDADYDGIELSFNSRNYKFGNIYTGSGTHLQIDDGNSFVNFNYQNTPNGLQFDYLTGQYNFGGFNVNLTYIQIDDGAQLMNFRNASGKYNFGDMPSYTDNADALANGLVSGDLYRHNGPLESQDQLRIVH